MNELKRIPTMSWLIRKANTLMRTDLAEYGKLCSSGTDKLIRGCMVRMTHPAFGHQMTFMLMGLANGKGSTSGAYAVIHGHKHKDEFYSFYSIECTSTKYRKSMHKWLPISLPEGMKCHKDSTAVFFNANGTKALEGRWYGGRRTRPGSPSTCYLAIRDSDGKFINYIDQHSEIKEFFEGHRAGDPVDLWHGFIPGTAELKADWYASMTPPTSENFDLDNSGKTAPLPEPLWDADRVKALAARVHSEAIRLSKAYPYIKVALIPGGPWGSESDDAYTRFRHHRFSSIRTPVVIGRDRTGSPMMWMLPELVVYWTVPASESIHKHQHEPRFMRLVIPPAGSHQLVRRDDESYLTTTYRWGPGDFRQWRNNVLNRGCVVERAYHQLLALRLDSEASGGLWHGSRYRNQRVKFGDHELDSRLHNWDENQDVVVAYSRLESSTYRTVDPVATCPEGVFNRIEERELIDSLPLC